MEINLGSKIFKKFMKTKYWDGYNNKLYKIGGHYEQKKYIQSRLNRECE